MGQDPTGKIKPPVDEDDGPTDPGLTGPVETSRLRRGAASTLVPGMATAPVSAPVTAQISPPFPSTTTTVPMPEVLPTRPRVGKMPELGLIETLMNDPTISEIMVNDLRNVMVEKDGKLVFSGLVYPGIDELNRLVRNILDATNRILTVDQPYVDLMLPDGSRVNIVGPPLTISGPCLTIRKFPARALTIEDLMTAELLDRRMAYFLNVCVVGRMNIVISGGTGSGKTTVLNALSSFVPKAERLITIEDTPEISLAHFNSVRLQTKPQTPGGAAVTTRDLLANALRMRPDRILVGECRKTEALDMLQAMNTGHAGSMTTLHANSPRDCLVRLETLCMMAGVELPLTAIRKQIASAVDLVLHIRRFRNGKRRMVGISEVTGMESDTITMQDIFTYETERVPGAAERGIFKCTGFVPTFIDRLREQGIELPRNYFG